MRNREALKKSYSPFFFFPFPFLFPSFSPLFSAASSVSSCRCCQRRAQRAAGVPRRGARPSSAGGRPAAATAARRRPRSLPPRPTPGSRLHPGFGDPSQLWGVQFRGPAPRRGPPRRSVTGGRAAPGREAGAPERTLRAPRPGRAPRRAVRGAGGGEPVRGGVNHPTNTR